MTGRGSFVGTGPRVTSRVAARPVEGRTISTGPCEPRDRFGNGVNPMTRITQLLRIQSTERPAEAESQNRKSSTEPTELYGAEQKERK